LNIKLLLWVAQFESFPVAQSGKKIEK